MYVPCSTVEEAENNLKNIKEEEGRSTGILINWTGEKCTHKQCTFFPEITQTHQYEQMHELTRD